MHKPLAVVAGLVLLAASPAYGVDSVKILSGSVTGKIVAMSATEVTVEPLSGNQKTIPVNEIQSIQFETEAIHLKNARAAVAGGRFQDALESLGKIKPSEAERRPEIQQDIQYYRAVAQAKLAMAGQGSLAEAATALTAFVKEQANNYHHLAACELLGDVLVADQKFEAAQGYYQELAQTPWPDYQMRAGVALGRALLADKKYDQAIRTFQEVIDKVAAGETAARQRTAATLGKCRGLIEAGKPEDAVKEIRSLIETTDARATDVMAQAYNTLGTAYRKLGRPQEALMAFLHTDVLYSASREDHAEALRNLVDLWGELKKPERAAQAQEQLKQLQ